MRVLIRPLCHLLAASALLLIAACGDDLGDGPLSVSVIGAAPELAIPTRAEPSASQAALLPAVAQGLVSFDAAGQIEAGLAERWNVSDDGMSYIFRLRDAEWADGKPVTADDVVTGLRAAVSDGSNNRLAMLFGAVDKILAVTPQVIEIRLKAPRPLLLPMLAQPELGLIKRKQGSGPYRIISSKDGEIALEALESGDEDEDPRALYPVHIRNERAARALVRFRQGSSATVLGGTFADLPVARAANLTPAQLRFDPAQGLFGLAVTAKQGFLSRADNRNAVAMAIDREAIVALSGVRDWRAAYSLLPQRLDLAGAPALPDWIRLNGDLRRGLARARVQAWLASYDEIPALRVALPEGPGMKTLFARLSVDLRAIGLQTVRVGAKEEADLQWVDSVSPSDSATWYLRRINCAAGMPCSEAAEKALVEARDTPSLEERARKLTEADAAFMVHMPFIPIASPLRWSAVSPRLTGFQINARAVHPLGRLLKP